MVKYELECFLSSLCTMRWLILVLLPVFPGYCQNYFQDHFGGSIGIVANVGTHTNTIGLNFKGYYTDYFFQTNLSSTFYLHERNLGNRKNYFEMRNAIGIVLLGGKRDNQIDPYLDALNHQTNYRYGIGYNYIWYYDNAETSQLSGGWSLHFNKFSIYHENDVFGGQGRDRFRTGHLQFAYRYDQIRLSAGVNIWTGETRGAEWVKASTDWCPNGFKMLEGNPYGHTSHGIAYMGIQYFMPYQQNAQLRIGMDSENVRHVFQNRLMHDLPFMPKSFKRTTPHYPRLDEYGCAIFSNEFKRKDRFYLQFGANNNWSD